MDRSVLRARVNQVLQETANVFHLREKELKKLLKEAERAEDAFVLGRVNLLLAICYFDLGNRNSILPYAVKAVEIFEKLKNRNMLCGSYNLLGLAYRAQGQFQKSQTPAENFGCFKDCTFLDNSTSLFRGIPSRDSVSTVSYSA